MNASLASLSPITLLSVSSWLDDLVGGADDDVVTAPWMARLTATDDFEADLDLDPQGAGVPAGTPVPSGGKVLRNATIGGTVGDAEWTVNGTVVRLKAGEVDRLDLTADAVKTVIVSGDMIDASFDLQQAFARNTKALNRLAVTGTVADTDIRAIDNIGVVIAGQMTGSTVFAGVADGVTGLPGAPDFTALDADGRQATIKSFTIKGGSGFAADVDLLSSSFVAAGSIGRAKVRNLTTDNGGTSFGFSADSRINVLNWFEDTTKVGRFSGTSWASVPAVDLGDFLVQVV